MITSRVVILNHPFFNCFQEHLPLNSILAVHLKTGKIVQAIIRSFECGDANNSPNATDLSLTAWNSIVDNMIDILYQNIAREYKTLPRKLVDLLTTNNRISVNLSTDVHGRLLRCFVGMPIARHVGTLTLPIYIADCFL